MKNHRLTIGILLLFVSCLIAIQVWISWKNKQLVLETLNELEKTQVIESPDNFSDNKLREEIIALRIENRKKSLFLHSFFTNFGTAVSIIVALTGGYIAFNQFISEKKKEKNEKFGSILNELWKGVMSNDTNVRAGSIAGLQQFLNDDHEQFHERVGLALSIAGRRKDNDMTVIRTLTSVVEHAFKCYPETMQKISWQELTLYRPDFSECILNNFDLRDCALQEGKFCKAEITHCRLNAANFKGSDFTNANLSYSDLEYADLALTKFINANLSNSKLYNAMVVDMNLRNANLKNAALSEHLTEWKLLKEWRDASYDPKITSYQEKYLPPKAKGHKVLILIWEYPPLIAGGAWTATYHMIKNLREKGADISVIVPWPNTKIDKKLFGNEIKLIGVGKQSQKKETMFSSYDNNFYSPYHNAYSYEQQGYSVYNNYFSSYNQPDEYINTYLKSPSIFQKIKEFKKNTLECILKEELKFDVIHAVDWITFDTANFIAEQQLIPWVAHYHSIESERHDKISNSIRNIEQKASIHSSKILVPSSVSKNNLLKEYNVDEKKVSIAYNCLSEEHMDQMTIGEFGSKTVGFAGRITWQKGPDIFLKIARELKAINSAYKFVMYGESDTQTQNLINSLNYIENNNENSYYSYNIKLAEIKGFVNWYERKKMFENMSAIIVPSRYEPFGMIVLEAMQYGVPVFYASSAGVSEVIKSGCRIEINEDPTSLAETINGILKDEAKWEKMTKEQCEELKNYSDRAYEDDIYSSWEEVIEGNS